MTAPHRLALANARAEADAATREGRWFDAIAAKSAAARYAADLAQLGEHLLRNGERIDQAARDLAAP